ncbi:MAG: HNH endonuclease [Actinomycetaceae bacterium]|nr:HNH endonuclease [Actinomycetaceae bacterium]
MIAKRVRVGIDVGSFSVGMTTIEVDENGSPLRILSAVSHIHDSGLDKDGKKQAKTRREVSGVARRARRLVRERRRRLQNLDEALVEMGYPIADLEGQADPYLVWRIRAQLVEERLPEDSMRYAVSMALRHIARHRGWRNPYSKVDSLLTPAPESEFMNAMRDRILRETGVVLDADVTPGQAMQQAALTSDLTMRGPEGLLGKLHQSDNANEIRRICEMQGIEDEECRKFIRAVFAAKSPRGSAVSRVGPDPLPGQEKYRRAPKCDPEFQRYRVISTVANLRIHDGGVLRRLTDEERQEAVDHLLTATSEDIGWVDVAEKLGIPRQDLHGTAALAADGERAAARPPVDATDRVMRKCGIKRLTLWWREADLERRSAMVSYLYEGVDDSECAEFLSSLSEEEQGKLDSLHLPAGRAAYSRESLVLLNERMLTTADDLHEARKHVFGVDDSWKPPREPIGAPVGNPSVDRTLKMVARYLNAVKNVYGDPGVIHIEHVRDGFVSEKQAREIERQNNRRFEQNQRTVAEIQESLGVRGEVRRSDVMRYEAIMIQGGVCVYCGSSIVYETAQLDHIVPQAGVGSNNRRENLVAVCEQCNRSKSNKVFSLWAASCGLEGLVLRRRLTV